MEGSEILWKEVDAKGVDGAVNGVAHSLGWLGKRASILQSGFVRNYALFMVLGFLLVLFLNPVITLFKNLLAFIA